MKYRDLARVLTKAGWRLKREGARHEIWSDGEHIVMVPRHNEINENTAKGVLRDAGISKE